MTTVSADRPDGRAAPTDVIALRTATRALREHLDSLPIDFYLGALPQRFLTGLAFASARQRYDYAESLVGAGFGGTAMGAISRGLLVDALRWQWISAGDRRDTGLLAELVSERSGICDLLSDTGSTCGVLNRWLQPLPNFAGLTGEARRWEQYDRIPGDAELLSDFLAGKLYPTSSTRKESQPLLDRMHGLLIGAELVGSSMILAHSGHGNYLGLLSSVAVNGGIGFDLRFDHEALFLQGAAIGVVGTLVGSAVADGHWWPQEISKVPFIDAAIDLAEEVSAAAVAVHGLAGKPAARTARSGKRSASIRSSLPQSTNPAATPRLTALLPDALSAELVWECAGEWFAHIGKLKVDPWGTHHPPFHAVLSYGAAISNLQSIFSAQGQPGAGIVVPPVARLLLEEAARTAWRYEVPDAPTFEAQAKQFFDEYRARRKKTIDQLAASGVARTAAERFFELPTFVDQSRVSTTVSPGRVPLPRIPVMLANLGRPFSEPGWLQVAYSMLSQMTHTTSLGLLHSVRFRRGTLENGELSAEITALSLDVACFAGTQILAAFGLILADFSDEALQWRVDLAKKSAKVHAIARLVHGLD